MLEVWYQGVDLIQTHGASSQPTLGEVELDGFVIGRTSRHPASWRPRWDDRFPVASNGRQLCFRLITDELVGDCQVQLQELLAQQQEGQISVSLVGKTGCVGTLWFAFRAMQHGSARPGLEALAAMAALHSPTSPSRSPVVKAGGVSCFGGMSRSKETGGAGYGFGFRCGSSSPSDAISPSPVAYARRAATGDSCLSSSAVASPSATPSTERTERAERDGRDGREGRARLSITEKGRGDLVELMKSKDKLRHLAERPFKARGLAAESRLGFTDFKHALRELLQELHMSVPSEQQTMALFDKHRGSTEGIGSEDFEALLFRLLCFLRASEEIRVSPGRDTKSEDRDKRWREEFLQKNPRKFNDVYEAKAQLGKGSFGTVYLVAHRTQRDTRNEQRVRVCKIIQKSKAKEAKTPETKVREELAVLKQLDHPNVLRIFEDFEDDDSFYLVMEQCRGGDLAEYVKVLEPMDAWSYEVWVAKVMLHTLSAIAYCHSKAVIHKDLKPENVMLSSPKHCPVQDLHVVVVDFGLAEVFAHPTDRSDVVSGTPPYMAPEVWQGNFSKSCDVWSSGCMLFFLLSGRLPFIAATVKEFPKAVQLEPEWAAMGGATLEAQQICKQMLQKLEHLRPTAVQCLKNKWFAKTDRQRILDRDQIRGLLALGQRSEFEKFITRFVATQIDVSGQKGINEAFRAFDTNGDGLLSLEELRQGLLPFCSSADQVDQVVRELDVTGTGQISYTEFLAGVINLRTKSPEEQDDLLWIAWGQFRPDDHGQVRVSSIQDALATRGMTVADMPDGFLAALNRESSGYITFDAFKKLLLGEAAKQAEEKHRSGKMVSWLMRKLQ